ncbi:MAG: hypothetical protein LBV51_04845, partial [Acholeplasmatales bacterium]|nr:hypothetical protein [Acholeplasmatales bacterium]
KTAPVNNSLPEYTNSSFTYNPTDNLSGINSLEYRHGSGEWTVFSGTITTLIEGTYYLRSTDNAGNTSIFQQIYFYKIDDFLNYERLYDSFKVDIWYSVTLPAWIFNTPQNNIAGKYSFMTYDDAFRFAYNKEYEFRVNINNGVFYYCSLSNENNIIGYTNIASLEQAVEYYAKKYVTTASSYSTNNNYYTIMNSNLEASSHGLTDNQLLVPSFLEGYGLNLILLSGNSIFYNNLGIVPSSVRIKLIGNNSGEIIDNLYIDIVYGISLKTQLLEIDKLIEGYYLIEEYDAAGNIQSFIAFLDLTPPELKAKVAYGNNDSDNINFTLNYIKDNTLNLFYIKFEMESLNDNIDSYAYVTISGIGINKTYRIGESLPKLGENEYYGIYFIILYDRAGNSVSFTIKIAQGSPSIKTSSLESGTTQLTVEIVLNDEFNSLVVLKLYSINYLGEYEQLLEDSNGTTIDFITRKYILKDGGKYIFYYEDIYLRAKYFPQFIYLKGLPSGILSIKNGGVTNSFVTFTYQGDVDYFIYITNSVGNELLFTNYSVTSEGTHTTIFFSNAAEWNGNYLIRLLNKANYTLFNEYYFTIDSVICEYTILNTNSLIVSSYSNTPFYINFSESGTHVTYYSSNDTLGYWSKREYISDTLLSSDGTYYFTITDYALNTISFEIILDSVVKYSVKGGKLIAKDYYISNNTLNLSFLETMTYNIIQGNNVIPNIDIITEGIYIIELRDSFDNYLTITLEIDKTAPVIYTDIGLTNNEVTNKNVIVSTEITGKLYYVQNGRDILVENPSLFDAHSSYRIKAVDAAGNSSYFEFRIDKIVEYSINISPNTIITNPIYKIVFNEVGATAQLFYEDSEDETEKLTQNGKYKMIFKDLLGNTDVIEYWYIRAINPNYNYIFTNLEILSINDILVTSDYSNKLILDEEGTYFIRYKTTIIEETIKLVVDNTPPSLTYTRTSEWFIIHDDFTEEIESIVLYKNGEVVNINFNKEASEVGNYKLVITDLAGNIDITEWTIVYKINIWGYLVIGIAVVVVGTGAFMIVKLRKPKVK